MWMWMGEVGEGERRRGLLPGLTETARRSARAASKMWPHDRNAWASVSHALARCGLAAVAASASSMASRVRPSSASRAILPRERSEIRADAARGRRAGASRARQVGTARLVQLPLSITAIREARSAPKRHRARISYAKAHEGSRRRSCSSSSQAAWKTVKASCSAISPVASRRWGVPDQEKTITCLPLASCQNHEPNLHRGDIIFGARPPNIAVSK